ncbi:MAG: PorV/PorQ family protein [Saprospiraceae bacterium]|nr:PorV/PorQ family protein [Saprospiraceae bacterium]MCF8252574.1 PorV/PorQ family protein [Saprospiraceae bacterium]MCF8282615.1 PorV/PorQ family protein [Bacteroidales bacterium]MCF8314160.1 PorV/PorQ family protein [Saprospiraceae bacterium]MCF8442926.1 PorV/PorQ family protein [Saprospiraceae bacterium]
MKFYSTLIGFSFFLLNLLVINQLQAQKYSNEFLSIGIGARAQGMGNSVVASIDDVTAGYWNPAGLAAISTEKGLQVGAMHSEWFAGVGKFDYLGMTLPFGSTNRRLGLSLIRFGIDDIPNTLSLFEDDGSVNYDNIVAFSAADYAFIGSYAQRMKATENSELLVGGNVKIVRRVIGSFANSWGFGVDLGMQYKLGKLRLGATARDITTTFNAWHVTFTEKEKDVLLATGNELPDINSIEITKPQLLLGGAYAFTYKKLKFMPEVNLVATTDGQRNTLISADPISLDPSAGMEVSYNDFLFLRAGISQFQKEKNFDGSDYLISRPALGIGLQLYSLRVDYAYTNLGDSQNRYSHVVSLQLDLKPKKKTASDF